MIKKGEQLLVINDSSLFPVIFYNRTASGNTEFGSTQEGLKYPSAGSYAVNGSDNAPSSYTLSASQNLERISIPNFNTQIDALRVVRAVRYNTVAARVDQVAVTFSGTAPAVGTDITVKIKLRCRDKYNSEYNTVFADGEITLYREFVVKTNTNVAIAQQFADNVNNVEQRVYAENPTMNITAAVGTSNSVNTVTLRPSSPAFEITSVETSYGTFVPAKTALTATLVGISDNQVGFYGRGVYDRLKMEVFQTPFNTYPYANESSDGSQLIQKGATYTAFLISLKVTNQTHQGLGTFNSPDTEFFDYWIYVNNSCTATLTALSGWINSLNETTTTGRKAVLSASSIVDYAAAYSVWSAPQRIVFPTSGYNYGTGIDTPNVLAATAATGFEITT